MAFRDLLLKLIPAASRPAAEEESRNWKAVCGNCGHETSVWDLGGIRYKASRGQITSTFGRCSQCGKLGFQRVHWRGQDAASRPAT